MAAGTTPRVQPSRARRSSAALLAVDVIALAAALLVAELASPASAPATPLVWLLAFTLLVLALFHARAMYRPRLRLQILDELRGVVTTTSLAAIVVMSLHVVLTSHAFIASQSVRT